MAVYQHREAFCLMKYAALDGSEVEWIWNSRDGVTPYAISNRAKTKEMRHVDWQLDRRILNYQPSPCERVFVDLTEERAREYATRRVELWWNNPEYPISHQYKSKEEAIAHVTAGLLQHPGAPDLVEYGSLKGVQMSSQAERN